MHIPSGIERILAPNPSVMTGSGTNTYLVTGDAGGCVVIDPGPDDEDHLQRVASRAAALGGLRAILITHGHPDHVEGAPRLRAMTQAPILAWSREGSLAATGTLADGDAIDAGGQTLRALHTPGHRFDHLCFLGESSGTLFTGDLVAGEGTVVISPPEGDLADYMASLRRLRSLDLRTMLPAHGPAIDDPAALLAYYIQHRLDRERQVVDALAVGPAPVSLLVERVYTDVDPTLHAVAAHSLTAHLLKLEREGRARRTSGSSEEIWELAG